MNRRIVITALAALVAAATLGSTTAARAAEAGPVPAAVSPVPPGHAFHPALAPDGFTGKHGDLLVLRPAKAKVPILDEGGRFTIVGQYLYDLTSDPANMAAHLRHAMSSDSGNWETVVTPLYRGTAMKNYSVVHRLPRCFNRFRDLVKDAPEVPAEMSARLMDERWVSGVEAAFREMIDDQSGLLADGRNTADMALVFHLLRTGFGSCDLRPERIYTLPKAQALVRTILTDPSILNAMDQWLPATPAYVAGVEKQNARTKNEDPTLVKDGRVFFTGGLFVGWKGQRPSLHGTWDGLAIVNTLFKYYPEPDPASDRSIFHLWHKEPADRREHARKALFTLRDRLWLDYQQKKGPSYCHIVSGRASVGECVPPDLNQPPEVPVLLDQAGYTRREMAGWAAACWEEMFGSPKRNTNDGLQSLLAILEGRVHRDLKTPTELQKPGTPDLARPVDKDEEGDK